MPPTDDASAGEQPATPLVSVITPTYRRAGMLRQALDSAVAQEFRDFEVIVSDNDCDPEVERIVAGYGDPRLRYRHNGRNVGALENALVAFREARGRYVTMLHDDDAWEPGYLARTVPALEADPTLSLAFCDHHIMGPDGRVDAAATERNSVVWRRSGMRPGVHRPFVTEALVDRSVPVAMASVIRRDPVDWDDFPPESGTIYDIWLAYLACRDGAGAHYVPERLTRYREHGGAITSTTRYDRQFVYCYDRFVTDPRLAEHRPVLRREAAVFRCGLALSLLAEGGPRGEARHLLWSSLVVKPSARALAALPLTVLPRGSLDAVRTLLRRLPRRVAVRA